MSDLKMHIVYMPFIERRSQGEGELALCDREQRLRIPGEPYESLVVKIDIDWNQRVLIRLDDDCGNKRK